MQNFDNYRKVCEGEGIVTSHEFETRISRHDQLQDGDVLTIPKNVTCFSIGVSGHSVEFVVFPDEYGNLKRVYLSWFNHGKGSVVDLLEESVSFKDFFRKYEGCSFKVNIKDGETKTPCGDVIPTKKYIFKWVSCC